MGWRIVDGKIEADWWTRLWWKADRWSADHLERYSQDKRERWTFLVPWWPFRLRWMLFFWCLIVKHCGGGTFGYYRCNRCGRDLG